MRASLPLDRYRPEWWRAAVVGTGLAALLGSLAYLLTTHWQSSRPAFEATAAPGCELHIGPCTAPFDGTRFIQLEFEPKALRPIQPLRVRVETAGFAADTAQIEFSGVHMNMGLIRSELSNAHDGSFYGDLVLPVCARGHMAWRAIVSVQGAAGVHRATFRFEVNRSDG